MDKERVENFDSEALNEEEEMSSEKVHWKI